MVPTRLYSMAPLGAGTPQVECQSSYLVRLAAAHHVSVRTLINREILPIAPLWAQAGGFVLNSAALNGSQGTAQKFVNALSQLTGRSDLTQLTLLWSVGKIDTRFAIRRHVAWCPACFEHWRSKGQPEYIPLLWLIKLNKVCLRHRHVLCEACISCNKSFFPLSPGLRIGYCPNCGTGLGLGRKRVDPSAPQLEISQAAESFLAESQRLRNLEESYFGTNIDRLKNDLFKGSLKKAAQFLGVSHTRVHAISKGVAAGASSLLRIASRLRVRPMSLLCEQLCDFRLRIPTTPQLPARRARRSRQAWQALATQAKCIYDKDPTLSCNEVARRLGIEGPHLRHMFPDLCRRISASYAENRRAYRKQRIANLKHKVIEATKSVYRSGLYPSARRVPKLLPADCDFRNPVLYRAWKATVTALHKGRPVCRRGT